MKHDLLLICPLLLMILLAGCTQDKGGELVPVEKTTSCSKPYILSPKGSCCLDLNDNGVCDVSESGTSSSEPSGSTQVSTTISGGGFLATTTSTSTTLAEMNDSSVGEEEFRREQMVCDRLINDTATKPAARITKLCLSSRSRVPYAGVDYTVSNLDGIISIAAVNGNQTRTVKSFPPFEDITFGNTVMRMIGNATHDSTFYVQVYAWVVEGEMACTMNSDCGDEGITGYACVNKVVYALSRYFRCINPGTILSSCQTIQNSKMLKECQENERCVNGDDECFPKECFDGVITKDEEEVDCGGACRPCQCFDGEKGPGEEGIDCGGFCKPCLGSKIPGVSDETPPEILIDPALEPVYYDERIDLSFKVNEPTDWCAYSINGGINVTLQRRNGVIHARKGVNRFTLYCRDLSGNINSVNASFTVVKTEALSCPLDEVNEPYSDRFDKILLYEADENVLGVPDRCDVNVFEYSITVLGDNDTNMGGIEATEILADSNLSTSRGSLSYECTTTGSLSINYLKAVKTPVNPGASKLRVLVYFKENTQVSRSDTFWRIYLYGPGGEIDPSTYIDLPYASRESACGTGVKYQELDLDALLGSLHADTLELRIGLYTSMLRSELSVAEMELSIE